MPSSPPNGQRADTMLLALYTLFCAGLGYILNVFYMPTVGTPWEYLVGIALLVFPFALMLWVIVVSVYAHHHILHLCNGCHPKAAAMLGREES